MFSYQHIYHAGGPADVVKHALLALLVQRMAVKPKPFGYFETHAGRGLYPLAAREMEKLGEFKNGFNKLWPLRAKLPPSLMPLMEVLMALNPRGEPAVYPGSPMVAASLMRATDTLHLCEGHPQELAALQDTFAGDPRVKIYDTDGPRRVPTLVPGLGGRALVLIDPSYEVKTEYASTANTVKAILRKCPKAVVMVWYPLLPDARHVPLVEGLAALGVEATYRAEVCWGKIPTKGPLDAEAKKGAYGTGQVVVNLPYDLDAVMAEAFGWLAPLLGGDEGSWKDGFMVNPV